MTYLNVQKNTNKKCYEVLFTVKYKPKYKSNMNGKAISCENVM